jgi:D-amino peptidase
MKVLISADMEGTCGLIHFNQVLPPDVGAKRGVTTSPDYQWARLLLTQEINAAVEGALEGGADEVIVNEAHDGMRNVLPAELHPRARLINGSLKPLPMMQGIDQGVDAVFFTGYHAAANTPGAVMAHTWSGAVQELRLNGTRVGECGLNAATAGNFNVPVVLVSGDDKLVAEAKLLLGQEIVGIVTKDGISAGGANQFNPEKVRQALREGARKAVKLAKVVKPLKLAAPIRMEIDWQNVSMADLAERLPGVERCSNIGVAYTAGEMITINKAFVTMLALAASIS